MFVKGHVFVSKVKIIYVYKLFFVSIEINTSIRLSAFKILLFLLKHFHEESILYTINQFKALFLYVIN